MAFLSKAATTNLVLFECGAFGGRAGNGKGGGDGSGTTNSPTFGQFRLSLVGDDSAGGDLNNNNLSPTNPKRHPATLPGELVAHALSFLCPGRSADDAATLFAAALVSRIWTPWALERLYSVCRPGVGRLPLLAASWQRQFPAAEGSESQLGNYSRLQHLVRFEGLFPSLPPPGHVPPKHPLKTLDLSLQSAAPAEVFHRLALHSPPVERLELASDYRNVSGGSLVSLLGRSPFLKHMVLPESYGEDRLSIDDFFLSLLPKFCSHLESLHFYTNGHITDRGIPHLSELPLKNLEMAVSPWRIAIPKFLDRLPRTMERLAMGKYKQAHGDHLIWYLRDCPRFRTLELVNADPGFFSADILSRLIEAAPGLRELDLSVDKNTVIPPPPPPAPVAVAAAPPQQPQQQAAADADQPLQEAIEQDTPNPNAPLLPLEPAAPQPTPAEPHYLHPLSQPNQLTHLRLKGHQLAPDFISKLLSTYIALDLRDCGPHLSSAFSSHPPTKEPFIVRVLDLRGSSLDPQLILQKCPRLKILALEGFTGDRKRGVKKGNEWVDLEGRGCWWLE